MDKQIKNLLTIGGAFLAIRLYKLYKLGESIVYKPVGISFIRGKSLDDFVVRIKMELFNRQATTLHMRGVDGILMIENQTIGTFYSAPFDIKGGNNYFYLNFQIDPKNVGTNIIQSLINKSVPMFIVEMNKRLTFFSMKERFAVNPKNVDTSNTIVK